MLPQSWGMHSFGFLSFLGFQYDFGVRMPALLMRSTNSMGWWGSNSMQQYSLRDIAGRAKEGFWSITGISQSMSANEMPVVIGQPPIGRIEGKLAYKYVDQADTEVQNHHFQQGDLDSWFRLPSFSCGHAWSSKLYP